VSGGEVRPLRPTASDALVPPHDESAEQAVLGAVLLSAAALLGLIAGGLRPDHFYRPRNGVIYAAILALTREREAVDAVTVCDRLRREGGLTRAGGEAYVHSLPTLVPAVGAVLDYAAIVRRHALARGLLERIRAWEAELLRRRDPDQVLQEAIGELLRVDAPDSEGPVAIEDLLHELMDELEERADRGGGLRGLASGFPDLDDITGGFRRGDLVVLAGRPSMGKTQLALNIASHAALAEAAGVLVFTFEMSREAAALLHLPAEHGGIERRRRVGVFLPGVDPAGDAVLVPVALGQGRSFGKRSPALSAAASGDRWAPLPLSAEMRASCPRCPRLRSGRPTSAPIAREQIAASPRGAVVTGSRPGAAVARPRRVRDQR
jgi:replicative DNA helicase